MPSSDPETTTSQPIPSLKDLASSDPSLRRKNLSTVLEHLTQRPSSSPLDTTQCLQLWRGFSVALYMHDSKSPLSVQKLISTLASTARLMYDKDVEHRSSSKTPTTAGKGSEWQWLSTWNSAFWETLSREWSGIDQWRINKYLLLIRFLIRSLLGLLFTSPSQSLVASQIEIFEKWPMSPRERRVPDGLRLHVLDVWMEEIDRARANAEAEGVSDTKQEKGEGDEESADAEVNSKDGRKRKRTTDDGDSPREGKKQNAARKTISHEEIVIKLIRPIRTLAKEALGKGVKMKAREIIKEVDATNEG